MCRSARWRRRRTKEPTSGSPGRGGTLNEVLALLDGIIRLFEATKGLPPRPPGAPPPWPDDLDEQPRALMPNDADTKWAGSIPRGRRLRPLLEVIAYPRQEPWRLRVSRRPRPAA